MKLIPLSTSGGKHSGKYFAQVDDADYELLSKFKWTVSIHKNTCYAERYSGKVKVKMHRAILGIVGKREILADHRDRNGLNNQRSNLREATRSQNNTNIAVRGRSKYYGVSYANGMWRVRIVVDGSRKNVGTFANEIVAAKAYNAAAEQYNCTFAPLNTL